jgi:hypothetical protein
VQNLTYVGEIWLSSPPPLSRTHSRTHARARDLVTGKSFRKIQFKKEDMLRSMQTRRSLWTCVLSIDFPAPVVP